MKKDFYYIATGLILIIGILLAFALWAIDRPTKQLNQPREYTQP